MAEVYEVVNGKITQLSVISAIDFDSEVGAVLRLVHLASLVP